MNNTKYVCFDVVVIANDTGFCHRKFGLESRESVRQFLDSEAKFYPFTYVCFGVESFDPRKRASRVCRKLFHGTRKCVPGTPDPWLIGKSDAQ